MIKKIPLKFITVYMLSLMIYSFAYSSQFLTLADIHYGLRNPSTTDDILWNTTLQKIQKLSLSSDFIVFLGDIPDHHVKNADEKSNIEAKIFHDLVNVARGKPIFYVPGNNDSLVGDYQSFSHNGASPLENAPEWEGGACANCTHLLIDHSFMHEKGYYSSYVLPNKKDIALIVLNGTQFTQIPWWLPSYRNQDKDATQQLNWLSSQLNYLKTKQLLIAIHEEPGLDYKNKLVWKEKYLNEFIKLLNAAHQYHKEITLLTAHSHYDEIRKITLSSGKAIYSYSTPSISRIHKNNSAMKVFYLNNNFKIKNFETYFTPINTQWNNKHYYAINSNNSIFPECQTHSLATCLNRFTTLEICNRLETQLIYGVKNPAADVKNCLNAYVINQNLKL